MLYLRRPIYKQTAAYGYFGRTDLKLPWERLDKVKELEQYLKYSIMKNCQKVLIILFIVWCQVLGKKSSQK